MGREARTPRTYYTDDAIAFRNRYPIVFPLISFLVGLWAGLTTGILPISRIERLLLWACIADLIYRWGVK